MPDSVGTPSTMQIPLLFRIVTHLNNITHNKCIQTRMTTTTTTTTKGSDNIIPQQ